MQNEAGVSLVLFLVSTFCEFGVKGTKTSVVVKKVVFFQLIFTIVRLSGIMRHRQIWISWTHYRIPVGVWGKAVPQGDPAPFLSKSVQ